MFDGLATYKSNTYKKKKETSLLNQIIKGIKRKCEVTRMQFKYILCLITNSSALPFKHNYRNFKYGPIK